LLQLQHNFRAPRLQLRNVSRVRLGTQRDGCFTLLQLGDLHDECIGDGVRQRSRAGCEGSRAPHAQLLLGSLQPTRDFLTLPVVVACAPSRFANLELKSVKLAPQRRHAFGQSALRRKTSRVDAASRDGDVCRGGADELPERAREAAPARTQLRRVRKTGRDVADAKSWEKRRRVHCNRDRGGRARRRGPPCDALHVDINGTIQQRRQVPQPLLLHRKRLQRFIRVPQQLMQLVGVSL
jgi:hypothetical protein